MKLYPKNYAVKEVTQEHGFSESRVAQAKALIEAFVADKPQYHSDIFDYVKKTMGLGGLPDIRQMIAEIDAEWHPVSAVEEPELGEVEEDNKAKKAKKK